MEGYNTYHCGQRASLAIGVDTESCEAGDGKGKIIVTYNGKGRKPGLFRKSITIHNNGKQTPVRLYIEGEMIDNTTPELIQDNTLYQDIYQ